MTNRDELADAAEANIRRFTDSLEQQGMPIDRVVAYVRAHVYSDEPVLDAFVAEFLDPTATRGRWHRVGVIDGIVIGTMLSGVLLAEVAANDTDNVFDSMINGPLAELGTIDLGTVIESLHIDVVRQILETSLTQAREPGVHPDHLYRLAQTQQLLWHGPWPPDPNEPRIGDESPPSDGQ